MAGYNVGCFGGSLLTLLMLGTTASAQRISLPARVEAYLDSAGTLSAHERRLLAAGQPVTKLLDADESKEIAVLGAV
jgi:uncharacterized membrane protein YgcG